MKIKRSKRVVGERRKQYMGSHKVNVRHQVRKAKSERYGRCRREAAEGEPVYQCWCIIHRLPLSATCHPSLTLPHSPAPHSLPPLPLICSLYEHSSPLTLSLSPPSPPPTPKGHPLSLPPWNSRPHVVGATAAGGRLRGSGPDHRVPHRGLPSEHQLLDQHSRGYDRRRWVHLLSLSLSLMYAYMTNIHYILTDNYINLLYLRIIITR